MKIRRVKSYSKRDILQAFEALGLNQGDSVFVTTSLGMLGHAEGVTDATSLNHLFWRCLRETLGPVGNILVPTYSYTFDQDTHHQPAVFNPKETPANIGPFPNFVLQQEGVLRSRDPFMSVAGFGPNCEAWFYDLPPSSNGADCLFARLINSSIKCLNIGLGPNWTPFIHHADWLAQVPFRYDKMFAGYFDEAIGKKQLWLFSVLCRLPSARADAHRIGQAAEESGIWHYANLGRGRVYLCDYLTYFDFVMSALAHDPWALATGPAVDPLIGERERVGYEQYYQQARNAHQQEGHPNANSLPLIGPSTDYWLDYLIHHLHVSEQRFPSGTPCFDHVVPEGWLCQHFSLSGRETYAEPALQYTEKISLETKFEWVKPYSLSHTGTVTPEILKQHRDFFSPFPAWIDRDWSLLHWPENGSETHTDQQDLELHLVCDTYFSELRVIELTEKTQNTHDVRPLGVLPLSVILHTQTFQQTGTFQHKSPHEKIQHFLSNAPANTAWILVTGPLGLIAWLHHKKPELPSHIYIACPSDTPNEFTTSTYLRAHWLPAGNNPIATQPITDVPIEISSCSYPH